MSRFFATNSESESESSSSEEEIQQRPSGVTGRPFAWSDEEEETKRVVRSARDKRYEDLTTIIKNMKNHKKIKDMANVLEDFEDLGKAFDKAKKIVEQDGMPRFFVRCLVELETFVNECWEDRDGRKAMSKNNAKSLTTLRQKIRKYIRDFETHMTAYKENPDEGEEKDSDGQDEQDEDSEEEDDAGPGLDTIEGVADADKVKKFLTGDEDQDDDDDSDWASSTDDDDDDEKYTGNLTADFFRKKVTGEGDVEKKTKKEDKRRVKVAAEAEDSEDEKEKETWTKVKRGISTGVKEKPRITFGKDVEINHEAVLKKLNELMSARGKKGTDRSEQIDLLSELRAIAQTHNLGDPLDCKILFCLISAIFDYNPNIAASMKPDVWDKCVKYIRELLALLFKNKSTIICSENVSDDSENFAGDAPYWIQGSILTVIERMDEEYIKMLQACDAHSTEYVDRLKDEPTVCEIIHELDDYLEGQGSPMELCRCYLKHIEHLYYKFDHKSRRMVDGIVDEKKPEAVPEEAPKDAPKDAAKEAVKVETPTVTITAAPAEEEATTPDESPKEGAADKKADEPSKEDAGDASGEKKEDGEAEPKAEDGEKEKESEPEEVKKPPRPYVSSQDMMNRLCKFIYEKDATDRIRTRAMLCHVYHHAMHDRWYEARDLMLMSHLQDTIQHSDIPTQIMYNRAMVQLGICAFRHSLVKDAHNCLVDIQSSGRAKELLAQGLLLQRQHERTPEQEKIEKRRQMPYHMHINLELLECVYLVSAMLMEIPYMAAHEMDARRRMISKNFHHVMRVSDRQPLVGPPESMREHIVAASKAMKIGDWKSCRDFVINEKMNSKVWDLFYQAERVRTMIVEKIQEESLRTYLFTYSSVYDSLDMDKLAKMFELREETVHSIISKMIINEELMASLDEPSQSVVMHKTEPRRLQSLALQLSEKVSSLVEYNERMMEVKHGGYYQRQGGQGGYRGGRGGHQDGDNYGGGGRRRNYDNEGGGGGGGYRRRNYDDQGGRGGGRRHYDDQGGGGRRGRYDDQGGGGRRGRYDDQGGGGRGRRNYDDQGGRGRGRGQRERY